MNPRHLAVFDRAGAPVHSVDRKGLHSVEALPRRLSRFLAMAGPTPVDRLADAMLSTRAEVEPQLTGALFAVVDGVVSLAEVGWEA